MIELQASLSSDLGCRVVFLVDLRVVKREKTGRVCGGGGPGEEDKVRPFPRASGQKRL